MRKFKILSIGDVCQKTTFNNGEHYSIKCDAHLINAISKYLKERKPEWEQKEIASAISQVKNLLNTQPLKQLMLIADDRKTNESPLIIDAVQRVLGESFIPQNIMEKIREKEGELRDAYVLEAIAYGNVGVSAYFSTITPDDRLEAHAWVKELTIMYKDDCSSFREVDSEVMLDYMTVVYLRSHTDNILGRSQSRYFISSTDKYLTMQLINPVRIQRLLAAFKTMDQTKLYHLINAFEVAANQMLNNKVFCNISWFQPYALVEHHGQLYYAGYYCKNFIAMIGQYQDRLNIHKNKLLKILDCIYGVGLAETMDSHAVMGYLDHMINNKECSTAYALIHRDDYIPLTQIQQPNGVLLIPDTTNVLEVDYDFFFTDQLNKQKIPGYYSIDLPTFNKLIPG